LVGGRHREWPWLGTPPGAGAGIGLGVVLTRFGGLAIHLFP
jgi:hypothetical protein